MCNVPHVFTSFMAYWPTAKQQKKQTSYLDTQRSSLLAYPYNSIFFPLSTMVGYRRRRHLPGEIK